jgi:gallate dioxygenase
MTGIATAIYENKASRAVKGETQRHLAHMKQQLAGAEALSGTYPFTLERSVKSYRINKYLHEMIVPAHRTLFRDDQETSFEQAGLSQEERSLIRELDWRGLIHYGVIFFIFTLPCADKLWKNFNKPAMRLMLCILWPDKKQRR